MKEKQHSKRQLSLSSLQTRTRAVTIWSVLMLTLTFSTLNAQIQTNVKLLTSQEQKYLNTAKSAHKDFRKLYQQFRKDSTDLSREVYKNAEDKSEEEIEQQIKNLSDSLYQAYELKSYEPLAESYELYQKDPDRWKELYEENKDLINKELGNYDQDGIIKDGIKEYSEELESIKQVVQSPDSIQAEDGIDEMANKQFSKLDEVQELQKQSASLPGEDAFNGDRSSSPEDELLSQAKTLGSNFLNENNEILQEAQQFGKLKKKYSTVLSSTDLSTAVKANSLQDESLGKRLIFGGSLQLTRDSEQINLDIAPLIGYKFNRKLSAGISGVYRATFGQQKEFFDYILDENVYGGRVFVEYQVVKGFFGHAEYESLNNVIRDPLTDTEYRKWVDGFLIGIGKSYRISRILKGNVMVLYNTIHQEGISPYKSPWQLRFGIGKF